MSVKKIDFNRELIFAEPSKLEYVYDLKYLHKVNNEFFPHLVRIKKLCNGSEYLMQYSDYGHPLYGHSDIKNAPELNAILKEGYIHLYKSSMGVVYSVGPFTENEYPERNGKFIASVKINWMEYD